MFIPGMVGIGYQQLTEHYYLPLLVLYGLMVGVPGLAQLITGLRWIMQTEDSSTESSSDVPPRSQSSTSSI